MGCVLFPEVVTARSAKVGAAVTRLQLPCGVPVVIRTLPMFSLTSGVRPRVTRPGNLRYALVRFHIPILVNCRTSFGSSAYDANVMRK